MIASLSGPSHLIMAHSQLCEEALGWAALGTNCTPINTTTMRPMVRSRFRDFIGANDEGQGARFGNGKAAEDCRSPKASGLRQRYKTRSVLECGSPLPLFDRANAMRSSTALYAPRPAISSRRCRPQTFLSSDPT